MNYIGPYGSYSLDGFEVDPYYTFNGFYGYDLPAGIHSWLNNTRITVGVDNILGKKPSLYNDTVGYDQSFVGRPQGRFFVISLRKTF